MKRSLKTKTLLIIIDLHPSPPSMNYREIIGPKKTSPVTTVTTPQAPKTSHATFGTQGSAALHAPLPTGGRALFEKLLTSTCGNSFWEPWGLRSEQTSNTTSLSLFVSCAMCPKSNMEVLGDVEGHHQ